MSSPIATTLFDFIDEFAQDLRAGDPEPLEAVDESAGVVVFCVSFFDQFFAGALTRPISGFTSESKRAAARVAEELKRESSAPPEARALVALFEKFCDVYSELIAGSYGAGKITYKEFHERYVRRLLTRAEAWAQIAPHLDLAARIEDALTVYDDAIREMQW